MKNILLFSLIFINTSLLANESQLNQRLYKASLDGNVEKIKRLVAIGADVNSSLENSYNKRKALDGALLGEHFYAVSTLLELGAKVDDYDNFYHDTTISRWIKNREAARETDSFVLILSKLLRNGASPNRGSLIVPLSYFIRNGYHRSFDVLVRNTHFRVSKSYRFSDLLIPTEEAVLKLDFQKLRTLISLKGSLNNSIDMLRSKFLQLKNGKDIEVECFRMLQYLSTQEARFNQVTFNKYHLELQSVLKKLKTIVVRRLYPNAPTGKYLLPALKLLASMYKIDINLELANVRNFNLLNILVSARSFNPLSCEAKYALEFSILDDNREREEFFRSKGVSTEDIQNCID
jgi:hypothetical protein